MSPRRSHRYAPGVNERERLHRRGRWLGTLARAWSQTWRVTRTGTELEATVLAGGPALYAFWHGQQLPLLPLHADRGIVGLASRSRDGSLLVGVLDALGYRAVRGSSSRGGAMGLRACIRAVRDGQSVGLAVDGPRGPRHVAAPGIGALAVSTGRPVVCMAAVCWPALRLRTWDGFVLPLPFARVMVHATVVPPSGSPDQVRSAVEQALQAVYTPQTTRNRN